MAAESEGNEDMLRSASEPDSEDWNIVNLPLNSSGSNTPLTDSSCEFVRVADDGIEYHRQSRKTNLSDTSDDDLEEESGAAAPTVGSQTIPSADSGEAAAQSLESSRDEELKHLREILEERVKSGSPSQSHSLLTADYCDFVHLPSGTEMRPEDFMDSSHVSSGSRSNRVPQRELNMPEYSDDDEDDIVRLNESGEEVVPDADDRVESDIVAPRMVDEADGNESSDELDGIRPVRHYKHSPNSEMNKLLTGMWLTAFGFAVGIAIGHSFGSVREAHLQREIQEGQKLRLRAVQDDLLMCLRKQEDIDQTINKLNEIENILVDAEHWRNEYEELLNLKLQNEEKWRVESRELKTTLADVEKSREQLAQSKSCTHDSEFLSRQEITLQSVHEKVEASLNDKDQLIQQFQNQTSAMKVELKTAEQMLNAYKKSNEEKSVLILGLKEQVLEMEREVFDMKVNSEIAEQSLTNDTVSLQQDVEGSGGQSAQDAANSADAPPQPKGEEAVVGDDVVAQNEAETSYRADLIDELTSCRFEVSSLKLSLENQADEYESAAQPMVVEQLKKKVASLQLKIREYEELEKQTNTTEQAPCAVFHFGENFRINVSSAQVLKLYEATKGQYESVQEFLVSEWRALVERTSGSQPKSEKSQWTDYVSSTKSTMSSLMSTMNSTWQDIKEMSETLVGPKIANRTAQIHERIQNRMHSVASTISRGFDVVTGKFRQPVRASPSYGTKSKKHGRFQHGEKTNKPRSSEEPSTANEGISKSEQKASRKFEKKLDKLRNDMSNLNELKFRDMKRSERRDIHERFDDFKEDYSHVLSKPGMEAVEDWVKCQAIWWKLNKSKRSRKTSGGDVFMDGCAVRLLPWQISAYATEIDEPAQNANTHPGEPSGSHADEADNNWLFGRAENRKYHRDEPDDWYWRRSHDYENRHVDQYQDIPYPKDEL